MTHVVTFIEPTGAIRDWLRGKSTIVAAVANDASGLVAVYAGGLPASPELPAIVVSRVGGTPDPVGPVDAGLYQFDCWAEKYSQASGLSSALGSLFLSTGTENLTSATAVVGITITGGPVYFPDQIRPDINRMVITAMVVTRPT